MVLEKISYQELEQYFEEEIQKIFNPESLIKERAINFEENYKNAFLEEEDVEWLGYDVQKRLKARNIKFESYIVFEHDFFDYFYDETLTQYFAYLMRFIFRKEQVKYKEIKPLYFDDIVKAYWNSIPEKNKIAQ